MMLQTYTDMISGKTDFIRGHKMKDPKILNNVHDILTANIELVDHSDWKQLLEMWAQSAFTRDVEEDFDSYVELKKILVEVLGASAKELDMLATQHVEQELDKQIPALMDNDEVIMFWEVYDCLTTQFDVDDEVVDYMINTIAINHGYQVYGNKIKHK